MPCLGPYIKILQRNCLLDLSQNQPLPLPLSGPPPLAPLIPGGPPRPNILNTATLLTDWDKILCGIK